MTYNPNYSELRCRLPALPSYSFCESKASKAVMFKLTAHNSQLPTQHFRINLVTKPFFSPFTKNQIMKTKFLAAVVTIFACSNKVAAQAAQDLSNLTSPTQVNVNLLPDIDNKRSLGNVSKSWDALYLDGAIFLSGKRFLADRAGAGTGNTVVGTSVLHANTSGYFNTGTGDSVLFLIPKDMRILLPGIMPCMPILTDMRTALLVSPHWLITTGIIIRPLELTPCRLIPQVPQMLP